MPHEPLTSAASVEQPHFLSLPEGERQQAKDFMQVRSDES